MPGRGAADDRDAAATASCSAGPGCSRRTAGSSTRAPSSRCARSRSTAPACAASARPTTTSATSCMQRFAPVIVERLQATRLRCSTSMATPAALSRGRRRRWCPRRCACAAAGARPPTPGRSSSSRPTAPAAALRARPVQDALRVRRRRGADLDQRRPGRPSRSSTRCARSARSTAAICARRAGRRRSACAGRSAAPGRSAEAEGRDVVVVAGGIGLAPLRPALLRAARASASATAASLLLYGGRAPEPAALPRRARALARRLRHRGRRHRRQRRRRLARPRRRGDDADPARELRPRAARWRWSCGPGGDDALRRRRRCASAASRPSASTSRWSAT